MPVEKPTLKSLSQLQSNRLLALFGLLLLSAFFGQAQNCDLTVRGRVIDEVTTVPLESVNVFIQETSQGTITDEQGVFVLENVCHGDYHLIFSHIGCETQKERLHIHEDATFTIFLSHTATSLHGYTVKGKREKVSAQPSAIVGRQEIEDNSNLSISQMVEDQAGVHLIKNGSGISKPVVHGLYGNRLLVLNNGIAQAGQQWGNDHSPEIDPFAADEIVVVKGVNAIEYGKGNLGSVMLVQSKPVNRDPHLHGQANYVFETNGRGHTLNARLESYATRVGWRVNGTLKKYGDRRTADYFLNNTGVEEANLSLRLERAWSERLLSDATLSTFNTRLGVLRGSHIGNLTDLEQALTKPVPFFTEPGFSYDIDAPQQRVAHHLAKLRTRYLITDKQKLEWVIAGQINDRKEFDVRRSGRSDIPSLSLLQSTFHSDVKFTNQFRENWELRVGNQTMVIDNENNPETGVFPLIPDYSSVSNGTFAMIAGEGVRSRIELGTRYDYEFQDVATFTRTIPIEVVRFENRFHNFSGLLSGQLEFIKGHSISLHSGYAMRNPGINELYSQGLHQGVSGIEEGDMELEIEKALKNVFEYKWLPNPNFSFSSLFYWQNFDGYIFLEPQDELRLTIRGSFPVFVYKQTDANIYGMDLSTQFTLSSAVVGTLRYSYLRGEDISNNEPLIFMPPNQLFGELVYRAANPIRFSNGTFLEETEVTLSNRFVFEQKNILAEQDFNPPPPMYSLLNLAVSTNVTTPRYKFRCFIKADNFLNVSYRDYLNRQRYFADDLGISVSIGIGVKF